MHNDVHFHTTAAQLPHAVKLVLNTTKPPVIVEAPAPAPMNMSPKNMLDGQFPVIVVASPTKTTNIVELSPIIAVGIPIHQIPVAADVLYGEMIPHLGDRRHPPPIGGWGGKRTKHVFKRERSYCSSNNLCNLRNNINATTLRLSNTVVAYAQSDALVNAAKTIKKMTANPSGVSILDEARRGLMISNNHGAITLQHTDMLDYETRVCYAVKSQGELVPQDLLLKCKCVAFTKASGNTQSSISQGRNVCSDLDTKNHCKHTIVLTALHFFTDSELAMFLA
jgi:hypothetical protein